MKAYTTIKNWFIGNIIDQTDDFYEKSRAHLMFDFPFITGSLLCVISTVCILYGVEHSVIAVTVSWLFCFSLLFILKLTQNVKLASLIYCIGVPTILIANLFLNHKTVHLGYPYWIVLLILISVFNIGFRYGVFLAFISGLAFIYYRQFLINNGFDHEISNPDSRFVQSVIEILLSTSMMLYVIKVYLDTSNKSEHALRDTNLQLTKRNEVIESQSEEKTIMLREIHHRVKNNLQIINSILRLQSMDITDEKALQIFDLSQKRIIAMSLIHERLYKIDKIQEQIAEDYIPLLTQDLIQLYSNEQEIVADTNFDDGFINQNNVVHFGLIINELISNSLKHGIKSKGTIYLSGHIIDHCMHVDYSDDGVGMPEDATKSFGMELIESLTEQLDGTFQYESETNEGVKFQFKFPISQKCLQ